MKILTTKLPTLILIIVLIFPLDIYASRVPVQTNRTNIQQQKLKRFNKRKAYFRKQLKKRKPNQTYTDSTPWLFIGTVVLLLGGLTLLVIGLALSVVALWAIGVGMLGILFLIAIVFLLILAFSLNGDMC